MDPLGRNTLHCSLIANRYPNTHSKFFQSSSITCCTRLHKKLVTVITSGLACFERYNKRATCVWNNRFSSFSHRAPSSMTNLFLPPGVAFGCRFCVTRETSWCYTSYPILPFLSVSAQSFPNTFARSKDPWGYVHTLLLHKNLVNLSNQSLLACMQP